MAYKTELKEEHDGPGIVSEPSCLERFRGSEIALRFLAEQGAYGVQEQ